MAAKKPRAKRHSAKAAKRKPPPRTTKKIEEPSEQGVCLSVSQAADEFGHDRRTIADRIAQLAIKPVAARNGYPVYRLRDLMEIERRGAEGKADPDKMGPFERAAHFKAEKERLNVDQIRGTLMQAELHRTEVSRILKVVGQELDVMCDVVERDVGCTPLVLEKIEHQIDLARERMHQGIMEPPAETAPPQSGQQELLPAEETADGSHG